MRLAAVLLMKLNVPNLIVFATWQDRGERWAISDSHCAVEDGIASGWRRCAQRCKPATLQFVCCHVVLQGYKSASLKITGRNGQNTSVSKSTKCVFRARENRSVRSSCRSLICLVRRQRHRRWRSCFT